MKVYLDKLKAKPEASRRRYAFAFSLLLTLAIGGGWLVNLRYSLSHSPVAQETTQEEDTLVALAKVPEPEVGTWQRIKLGWQSLTANVIRK